MLDNRSIYHETWRTKAECEVDVREKDVYYFQRDYALKSGSASRGAKQHISCTLEAAWHHIQAVPLPNYHEAWLSDTPVKIYLDYDRGKDHYDPEQSIEDIRNLCFEIKRLAPSIEHTLILKSTPDEGYIGPQKNSYHLIFTGAHFSNAVALKAWIKHHLSVPFRELIRLKILDLQIYRSSGSLRTALSAKPGDPRPLCFLSTSDFLETKTEVTIPRDAVDYALFEQSCVTAIDPLSVHIADVASSTASTTASSSLQPAEQTYSDKEVVKKYLELLSPDRYKVRNKWLNIGYILRSINPEYKDLWHWFSAQWSQYRYTDAEGAWESLAGGQMYTLESLKHLASLDSQSTFDETETNILRHDMALLVPHDNILSMYIYRKLSGKYVCSEAASDEWYAFRDGRWHLEDRSVTLRRAVIFDIYHDVERYRNELFAKGAPKEDLKRYWYIMGTLGRGIKLNSLQLVFYNPQFKDVLDSNKDLLGFDNGVYDLSTHEFRSAVNSDYVSMSVGYNYAMISEQSPERQALDTLICQILPDPEIREYTLQTMASCLDGHIRDQNFYMWAGKRGSGSNGKSTLVSLLMKALGDYACISPASLVTGMREGANEANSALMSIKGKRVVLLSEPAATQNIQADLLKLYTGGDPISARKLHHEQETFEPQAKFILVCNNPPGVSEMDGGVARRIKLIEFLSRFVDDPSADPALRQFKIDRDIPLRLNDLRLALINLLLEKYKPYKENGLCQPPSAVMQATLKYETDNNLVKQFIIDHICKGKPTDYITKAQLVQEYTHNPALRAGFRKTSLFLTHLCNELGSDLRPPPRRAAAMTSNERSGGVLMGYYLSLGNLDDDDEEEENNEDAQLPDLARLELE